MVGIKNSIFAFGLTIFCLVGLSHAFAFQPVPLLGIRHSPGTKTSRHAHSLISKSGIGMSSEQSNGDESGSKNHLRDRLRDATGFSLTAFRSAWRAATGISLTAIYATALAASGLWIRKITSTVLSIFPAWFRYFLQPFLVAYYLPMFVIRGLTGPTRKQAKARHEAVKDGLRDAVEFAKQTTSDGYWPVQVTGDGDLELISPPKPGDGDLELVSPSKQKQNQRDELADAVADSVEQAMEQGFKPGE